MFLKYRSKKQTRVTQPEQMQLARHDTFQNLPNNRNCNTVNNTHDHYSFDPIAAMKTGMEEYHAYVLIISDNLDAIVLLTAAMDIIN